MFEDVYRERQVVLTLRCCCYVEVTDKDVETGEACVSGSFR